LAAFFFSNRERQYPSPVCPKSGSLRLGFGLLGLRLGQHHPALVLRDRRRLLDEDLVADLVGVVLVVRLVLLRHTHDLLHHRMSEATLDLDDDRLLVLVADDGALQNALWHDLRPYAFLAAAFSA